jgi:hypothetical protein
MFVYLDTCIVIYSVEGQAPFRQRAQTHIAMLEAAGYRFFVSDLTRGECLVHPLGRGDATVLLGYQRFFLSRSLSTRAQRKALAQRNANGTETGTRLVWRARPSASRFHSRAGFQTPIFPSIRALSWFAATPCGPK